MKLRVFRDALMNQNEIKNYVIDLSDDEKRNLLGEILKYYIESDNDISAYVGYPLSHFDWEVLYDDLLAFRRFKNNQKTQK
ncbi:MAG: hypothetical protein L3J14_06960 [Flavobacteriaceae bacterium]|nr:hypothetical protein [Flavobacteriaceae bacterium]